MPQTGLRAVLAADVCEVAIPQVATATMKNSSAGAAAVGVMTSRSGLLREMAFATTPSEK